MLEHLMPRFPYSDRINPYTTTSISESDIPEVTDMVDQAIRMDDGNYLLAFSGSNFTVLNMEQAIHTPYVLVTSIRDVDNQQHYIYFLMRDEVDQVNSYGFYSLKHGLLDRVINLVEEIDPKSKLLSAHHSDIGLFQIHLGRGNLYHECGTALLHVRLGE